MADQPVFDGSRQKVSWANKLIADLKTEIVAFLARDPFPFLLGDDLEAERTYLFCNVREVVPRHLPLMLGDALHNLRAALDLLANDLVANCTGKHKIRDAYFPIYKSSEEFEKQVKKKLKGASPELIERLRKFQPFSTGDNSLRGLHELDVGNKHKRIITTVGATLLNPLYIFPRMKPELNSEPRQTTSIRGVTFRHLRVDPTALGMQKCCGYPSHWFLVPTEKFPATFSFCFGNGEPFPGKDAVATAELLSTKVMEVIERFED